MIARAKFKKTKFNFKSKLKRKLFELTFEKMNFKVSLTYDVWSPDSGLGLHGWKLIYSPSEVVPASSSYLNLSADPSNENIPFGNFIFKILLMVFGSIIPGQECRTIGMGSLLGSKLEQTLLPKLHQRYKNGGNKKILSILLKQGR